MNAPDFSGEDLQGTAHTLAQYRGRPLVLYFWASWCPYCIQDIENMISVYKDFSARGVAFVSVGLEDNKARIEKIVAEHKIPYPVIYDGKVWNNKIAENYDVHGTPTFVLIKANGEVKAAGSSASELSDLLKKL